MKGKINHNILGVTFIFIFEGTLHSCNITRNSSSNVTPDVEGINFEEFYEDISILEDAEDIYEYHQYDNDFKEVLEEDLSGCISWEEFVISCARVAIHPDYQPYIQCYPREWPEDCGLNATVKNNDCLQFIWENLCNETLEPIEDCIPYSLNHSKCGPSAPPESPCFDDVPMPEVDFDSEYLQPVFIRYCIDNFVGTFQAGYEATITMCDNKLEIGLKGHCMFCNEGSPCWDAYQIAFIRIPKNIELGSVDFLPWPENCAHCGCRMDLCEGMDCVDCCSCGMPVGCPCCTGWVSLEPERELPPCEL